MKITGYREHIARMRGMTDEAAIAQVGAALFAGGQAIQVEAQISITEGAVSGKHHVASAPGEPPNNDTGLLANSIETLQVAPLRVEVSSNAPYAVALEVGTSRMGPRPYMAPAAARGRPKVAELVVAAVNSVTGG